MTAFEGKQGVFGGAQVADPGGFGGVETDISGGLEVARPGTGTETLETAFAVALRAASEASPYE